MEQKYNIELIEEYEDINFYSIHLEGEEIIGVTINMGKPIWEPELIPFASDKVKDLTVEAAGQTFELTTMNTGVPHTVAFVESLEWDWHKAGLPPVQPPSRIRVAPSSALHRLLHIAAPQRPKTSARFGSDADDALRGPF